MSLDMDDLIKPPYCKACGWVLQQLTHMGTVRHVHAAQAGRQDHEPVPVALGEVADPRMVCDFCESAPPLWIYPVAAITKVRLETGRIVDEQQQHQGRYGNRIRDISWRERDRRQTGGMRTVGNLSENWSACERCAPYLDAGDMWGIVRRVIEFFPAKDRTAKTLAATRARVLALYEPVFATIDPAGRVAVADVLALARGRR